MTMQRRSGGLPASGERKMKRREPDALLDRYRSGWEALQEALAGLRDVELDRRPGDGGWSIREIIHHLADSAMVTAIRLRRLVAEERPVLEAWDEEEYARRLSYESRPVGPSLEAVRAAIETTTTILDRLDEEAWTRPARHTERGEYNLEIALEYSAGHVHDHALQIERIRRSA